MQARFIATYCQGNVALGPGSKATSSCSRRLSYIMCVWNDMGNVLKGSVFATTNIPAWRQPRSLTGRGYTNAQYIEGERYGLSSAA